MFAFAGRSYSLYAPLRRLLPICSSVEAIYALQSVKRTLEAADHDLRRHRVAAIRYISAAERQIREALAVASTAS